MYKSTKFDSSRELVNRFHQLADYLNSIEEFKLEAGAYLSNYNGQLSIRFDSKETFVKAVKAVGSASKKYTDSSTYPELIVNANHAPLEFSILRDRVCKKTVTFDCEPLFSEDEVAAL